VSNFDSASGSTVGYSGDLSPTGSEVAYRPVARIIDATEGDRGAAAFGTDVGIAEYSNAQFLSDDQGLGAYPRPNKLDLEVVNYQSLGYLSVNLSFPAGSDQGEPDYYVAALTPLSRGAATGTQLYTVTDVDPAVLQGYGQKLIPRAIGYSTTV